MVRKDRWQIMTDQKACLVIAFFCWTSLQVNSNLLLSLPNTPAMNASLMHWNLDLAMLPSKQMPGHWPFILGKHFDDSGQFWRVFSIRHACCWNKHFFCECHGTIEPWSLGLGDWRFRSQGGTSWNDHCVCRCLPCHDDCYDTCLAKKKFSRRRGTCPPWDLPNDVSWMKTPQVSQMSPWGLRP